MITVREVASYMRVSLPTVYKLLSEGQIPHVKIGVRYIIPRYAFHEWLDRNTIGGHAHE